MGVTRWAIDPPRPPTIWMMTFTTLALICLLAMLGPVFSLPRRVSVPVVSGELLVGIGLGASGLRVIDSADPTFTFMAQIGFALVMYTAGTHVPLRDEDIRLGLGIGLGRVLVVGVLALPVGLGLAHVFGTRNGLLYAVVLASSSASLVMPSLGPVKARTRKGMEFLAQIAIGDTVCVIVLPLVIDPARVVRAALGTTVVLALAGGCYLLLNRAVRAGNQERLQEVSRSRHLAFELRIVLFLIFALAAVAASMGISVMLAGFALGLAVAAVGEPKRVSRQVFALSEGFFSPLFFVWLGASLDLRTLVDHPRAMMLGLCLGVAAVVLHAVPSLGGQPLSMAVATSGQLGVPIGAAALGQIAGVFQPGEATALLAGALVTVAAVSAVMRPLRQRMRA